MPGSPFALTDPSGTTFEPDESFDGCIPRTVLIGNGFRLRGLGRSVKRNRAFPLAQSDKRRPGSQIRALHEGCESVRGRCRALPVAENSHDEMSFNLNPFTIRDFVVNAFQLPPRLRNQPMGPCHGPNSPFVLAVLARNAASDSKPSPFDY